MEFQEAVMKVMIRKTPHHHHKDIFHKKERVASKPKWWFTLHRSNSTSNSNPEAQPPGEFSCPISGCLMADPVIVSSGHTFERACVEACKILHFLPTLQDGSNPDFSTVIPNLALKSTILSWCQIHSLNPPKPILSSKAEELVLALMPKLDNEKVSKSENELIQRIEPTPPVKFDHAATELNRRPIHFATCSEESVTATRAPTPPCEFVTRPSCCFSVSSSSSEMEAITPEMINQEEESFLSKLKSPQVFDVEEAVVWLRKITRADDSCRVALCTPRLLQVFRSLIMSRYVNVQANSVAALVNLSLEKLNKVKIVRSGLVPVLIDVLKSGFPEAQEHASGALFSLALDDHNKTAIGVLGALQPLMHMLRSGSERTQHDAALALYHLTLVQGNRSKLVRMGSVPVLLGMVKSGQMTRRVLLILFNIASCSDGRTAVLDSGGVECLVSWLRKGEWDDEPSREGCVVVLYALSHGGLRFKGLAKAAGAVEELMKVERNGSERAREKARRMLEMMKGRTHDEEETEDVNWEELLDSSFTTRTLTRSRVGVSQGKDRSCVNSSEF